MTPENFASWMGQIGVLVAAAALLSLGLKYAPCARLIFWQGVLALAVLLPLAQPWPAEHADSTGIAISTGVAYINSAPAASHFSWRFEYLLWIAALGAAARLLWIAAGLFRLRRHRLAATRLQNPPVPFERVDWYVSETVTGPVTFGWLRPVILLPARFRSMPAELQHAIACHELIHVRRRDWLFVIFEEIVRAAFWFHPAVWFALSRIQLAREQAVDLEAIGITRDRDRYLDALVAVAEQKFRPDLAPAPLFLTRRHLATRVAAILKETRMSKARLTAAVSAVSTAALLAARLAVFVFPLHSSAQTVDAGIPDGPGITVDTGAPVLHRTPVFRPRSATAAGTVVIDATLDSRGEISDARVVSGPDELRRTALESVLQWHYSTDPAPPQTVRATIQFAAVAANPPTSTESAAAPAATSATATASAQPVTLKSIQFVGVPDALAQKVRAALPIHEGDQLPPEILKLPLKGIDQHVTGGVSQIDEHLAAHLTISPAHEATLTVTLDSPAARMAGTTSTPAPPLPSAPQRIRVGGNVQQANLLVKVTPAYPPDAKAARIQGIVHLTVVIGKDGIVQNVQLVDGDAMLAQSAIDAVKQWVYKPTLLNGNPVEVITAVDVNYTLSQ